MCGFFVPFCKSLNPVSRIDARIGTAVGARASRGCVMFLWRDARKRKILGGEFLRSSFTFTYSTCYVLAISVCPCRLDHCFTGAVSPTIRSAFSRPFTCFLLTLFSVQPPIRPRT